MEPNQMIERFKALYGDGDAEMTDDGRISLPEWLWRLLLHNSGIRSKRARIQKKVIKRETMRAIYRGIKREDLAE
jgi:hypothetical protein